ncbi:unnamed protein product [Phytophthora fragariaefolia]|uniref:Unnamed protein product n=1 Tax=Phytophthora fragariaefolia TaxID=1490495 RepID=A0A9W6XX60_9STRA|nr:unnamed protein product [Phytophthora fragariaefolia]
MATFVLGNAAAGSALDKLERAAGTMNNLFNRNKTFRPQKNHSRGTKRYDLHKQAQATLGKYVVLKL